MILLDTLISARDLIQKEDNWCQWCPAKDKSGGLLVDPNNKRAVAFCAVGAIVRVTGDQSSPAAWDAFQAMKLGECYNLAAFNNSHTHAEVIGLFDEAIAAERERMRIQDQVSAIMAEATQGAGEWEVYTAPESLGWPSKASLRRGTVYKTRPVAVGREFEGGIEIVFLPE